MSEIAKVSKSRCFKILTKLFMKKITLETILPFVFHRK